MQRIVTLIFFMTMVCLFALAQSVKELDPQNFEKK